jgi:hypothetical protein
LLAAEAIAMARNASTSELPVWRFRLGLASFVAAFAVHLVTLALILAGAGPATIAAVTAVNFVLNKVFLIATVALLGREGFVYLKGLVFGAIRRSIRPEEVGPIRYGIGLVLFVLPLVLAWIAPYVAEIAPGFGRDTVRDGIIGDALLIVSLVVLGGGFWDKLRALFTRRAVAVFPNATASP